MSYCKGDVYCYGTFDPETEKPYWNIHISYLLEHKLCGSTFMVWSLEAVLSIFRYLQTEGIQVPSRAIKRIEKEIKNTHVGDSQT